MKQPQADYDTTRNAARKAFDDAGLSYAALSKASMQRLRTLVNDRMTASGLIKGTFRCRQRGVVQKTSHGRYAELRCKSFYFDNREAITFNDDGFIGFAGWADDTNIQPILEGFRDWVAEMARATP